MLQLSLLCLLNCNNAYKRKKYSKIYSVNYYYDLMDYNLFYGGKIMSLEETVNSLDMRINTSQLSLVYLNQ